MPRRGRSPSFRGRHPLCQPALDHSKLRSAGLARLKRPGRIRLKCMAASTSVPVEEYLRTSYEPDMEYVDGELVERHVGEHKHSCLQTLAVLELGLRESAHKFRVLTAQRLKVLGTNTGTAFRMSA